MLGSYRLSGEEYRGISGYFLLLRQDGMDAVWKWVILGSVAVPLLFFVISGRRKREHIWQWYLVAAMVLPVFFEAVNLIWHRGTYVCFPDAIWLYAGVCRDLYGSGARAGFCGR